MSIVPYLVVLSTVLSQKIGGVIMSMSIITNIKKIASDRNLTIKQIGKESGVGENAIYRWDKQNPNLSSLKKVSDYLNVSVDELLESDKQEV